VGAQRDNKTSNSYQPVEKKSARLDKISDLQEVIKDFTVFSTLYMKISIFGPR
jgi:hypothetical protein